MEPALELSPNEAPPSHHKHTSDLMGIEKYELVQL